MNFTIPSFQKRLEISNPIFVSILAALAAFSTYSCMYAFRKPFTAATFDGLSYAGVQLKILLVISQLIGYTSASSSASAL